MLLVDEADFAPETLILQAIIPILMMNEAVAIFISTPDDYDSTFMRMVTRVDASGNPYMPVIWLGSPCEKCKQEEQKICPHVWYEAPSHKAPWRYKRLQWIYDHHKDIDARENHARPTSRTRPSFPAPLVDDLFARPRRPHNRHARCVFLSVDPACGGENDFAITAGYGDANSFTVCLIDEFNDTCDRCRVVVV